MYWHTRTTYTVQYGAHSFAYQFHEECTLLAELNVLFIIHVRLLPALGLCSESNGWWRHIWLEYVFY